MPINYKQLAAACGHLNIITRVFYLPLIECIPAQLELCGHIRAVYWVSE